MRDVVSTTTELKSKQALMDSENPKTRSIATIPPSSLPIMIVCFLSLIILVVQLVLNANGIV